MTEEDITCSECESEFFICYENKDAPSYCPFCGETLIDIEEIQIEVDWE